MMLLTDKQVREKLVTRGAQELTDAELLSVLLQKGEAGGSALELSEALLAAYGGDLTAIAQESVIRLRSVVRLGVTRAAFVSAALELGRRCRAAESQVKDTIMTDRDVIEIFQPQLGMLPHEEFWVIYLNASNRILDRVRVSQGGVTGTVVDYKLVVKRAIERLAQGILLVHNHPSGNPLPSGADNEITERVVRAAALFDMTVADHVIITAGECYSFRNHGFFDRIDAERTPILHDR